MPRANTTANAILGLLALRPSWTATELTDQIGRNMRYFWPRAASRVFAEARALVARGSATATAEERSGRGAQIRTRYRITPAGRRRLRRWLASPPKPAVLESEALLRVLLADLGTTDDLLTAIRSVGAEADELFTVADGIAHEYLTGTAPFQDDVHARALVFDYLVGFARLSADWALRAEEYVARWNDMDDDRRADAGVDLIRRSAARSSDPLASVV